MLARFLSFCQKMFLFKASLKKKIPSNLICRTCKLPARIVPTIKTIFEELDIIEEEYYTAL